MVLDSGGLDPTVVVGGRAGRAGLGRAPRQGRLHGGGGGRVRPLVPEALAHDRRRHQHRPRAPRHLPATSPDVQEAFVDFVNKVPFYGAARAVPRRRRRCRTSCRASSGASSPTASPRRRTSARATCALDADWARPTRRVQRGIGAGPDRARRARRAQRPELAGRGGGRARPGRRLRRGSARASPPSPASTAASRCAARRAASLVVDDYGHHPTEIRATLEALRGARGRAAHGGALPAAPLHAHPAPVGRVLPRLPPGRRCCSWPTSTPAGEEPIDGVDREALAAAIGRRGHRQVVYAGDLKRPRATGWPRRCARATSCSRSARAACGRPATSC